MVKETTPKELGTIPVFEDLPEDVLQWVLDKGTGFLLEPGEQLFKKGDPAENLTIVLKGKVQVKFEIGGQLLPVATINAGEVTGYLPYSRMKTTGGYGVVIEPTKVIQLHKDHFPEMEKTSPELVKRLVQQMLNRVREGTHSAGQREKLNALGKLSAGLAHELNNPAAAIARTTAELKKRIERIPQNALELTKKQLNPDQLLAVVGCVTDKNAQNIHHNLSMLEKSEREEEILDWLEDHGLEDGFEIAESFLEANLTPNDLDHVADEVPDDSLPVALNWLEISLSSKRLILEIEDAAKRISELVGSIKNYTHMDQAPEKQETDVRQGIDNTVIMLGHKLRKKNIQLERNYAPELPPIKAHPGELNQVWTNLIDNAVDAMQPSGTLQIHAREEAGFLKVSIIDNGPGISDELKDKIFEPFFTTKTQGQGTGLGLDIVNRIVHNHQGHIHLNTQPGRTEFEVNFSLESE